MSTETEQQAVEPGTVAEQQVSEKTITEDIEASYKGADVPEVDVEVTDEDIEAELAALETEALEPPPKWDRRYKDAFADLGKVEKGRDYQQAMIDLYNEVQGYATNIEQDRAQWRKFAEPIQHALQPYQQFIAQSGATPDQMVRQALGLVMRLSQDPRATLQGLAQRAGINLQQLGEDAPYIDPQVQNLQQTIQQMRAEQRQREERQAREYQQRALTDVEQQIRTFTEAKDEQGKPKFPHVNLVEPEMATLIRGNPSLSLEDAYYKACKLSDEVAQAEERRKQNEDAARKAAKAKKEALAAKRVSGKPGVDTPPEESTEETIRKLYRQQSQAA